MIMNKKGNLLENVIIVMLTLAVFFAWYPAVNAIITEVLGEITGVSDTVSFLINSVWFVLIFGMLKWVYSSVSN